MVINDFGGSNVNNYKDVRGHSITSNKVISRTISMSSSEASVDYATRIEHLNNISDNVKIRDLIDSSQLSYTEPKKIQINGTTDHRNRVCSQQDIENMPALNSTPIQCVDNDIINIQLPYNPNIPTEPELWDGSFHPI